MELPRIVLQSLSVAFCSRHFCLSDTAFNSSLLPTTLAHTGSCDSVVRWIWVSVTQSINSPINQSICFGWCDSTIWASEMTSAVQKHHSRETFKASLDDSRPVGKKWNGGGEVSRPTQRRCYSNLHFRILILIQLVLFSWPTFTIITQANL